MGTSTITRLLGLPWWSTIGAVAAGVVVGVMLYGLTVHQAYRYFKLYPDDRFYLKTIVSTVLMLETFHTALWLVVGYHYLLAEAFDPDDFPRGVWSVRLTILTTALTICITQCFFAYRVFCLRVQPRVPSQYTSRWLLIPALLFLTVSKGFAFAAGIKVFNTTPRITDFQHITWLIATAYGLACVTDVTLASILVLVLRRSRTGSKRTDSVLDILIKYTINTGVLTSFCSVLAFLFAVIFPGNLIYAGISIVGTKLYANSLLAVLNSRRFINNRFLDDFTSVELPELSHDVQGHLRRPQGLESSLAFVVPQRRSTCNSGQSTIIDEITFARQTFATDATHNTEV
ncbi:hypothetical protein BD413DRAFT_311019 [Trametes elegans]|nr:hypothetical protein BD413DRAFT_311019 [Trametes elegans]